jgi:hypothetical protein
MTATHMWRCASTNWRPPVLILLLLLWDPRDIIEIEGLFGDKQTKEAGASWVQAGASWVQAGAQRHAAASEPLYEQHIAAGLVCHANVRQKIPLVSAFAANGCWDLPRAQMKRKQANWMKPGSRKSKTRTVYTADRKSVLGHLNMCVAITVASGASARVGGSDHTPCGSNCT